MSASAAAKSRLFEFLERSGKLPKLVEDAAEDEPLEFSGELEDEPEFEAATELPPEKPSPAAFAKALFRARQLA